jgi:hypothetical protein
MHRPDSNKNLRIKEHESKRNSTDLIATLPVGLKIKFFACVPEREESWRHVSPSYRKTSYIYYLLGLVDGSVIESTDYDP